MVNFDSRNRTYKSFVGAIPTDSSVKLKIMVSRSISCSGARLTVRKDGEQYVRYNMFWAGMCGDENEWWELHFSATTPGIYWYHFELDTPWGVTEIRNIGKGIGIVSADGNDFQQTVYDKAFKTPDWLRGGIIYQIFPDRFFNSGSEKKGVPTDRVVHTSWNEQPVWRPNEQGKVLNNDFFCGDLKGIEQKLDYISELGVTCIYLNPIFESHSNHRYDTADYMKIDPMLGTEEDLKNLCAAARKKGISIVLDGVFSHTGSDSRYFNKQERYNKDGAFNKIDSPYKNWYKFISWPEKYHSWWGFETLPEIQEENEEFQNFVFGDNGVIRKWLSCGVKGWRLDVADELPDVFLDNLRKCVKGYDRNAVVIGEVWEDATTKSAYGVRRKYFLGSQLDSVMNYPFANAILSFVRYGDAAVFADRIMEIVENYPPHVLSLLMNHIGTHDTQRAITALAGEVCTNQGREWQSQRKLSDEQYSRGKKLLFLAAVLQYTLPGVPSVYYGDEIGMQGYKDPFNRAPFAWDNIDESIHSKYVMLGSIRRACKAFDDGDFAFLYSQNNTVAFTRNTEDEQVLVALNRGEEDSFVFVGTEWERSYNIIGDLPKDGWLCVKSENCVILKK